MFRSASLARSLPSLVRPSMRPAAVAAIGARRTIVHSVRDENDLRGLIEKNSDKLIVVDWSATWCGPCKKIAPVFESLSEENKNVVFIKADVDVLSSASAEAGVQSVPTFHFIKNNEMVAEFSGGDQSKLKNLIKEHA